MIDIKIYMKGLAQAGAIVLATLFVALLTTFILQNLNNLTEKIEHQHVQRINPKHIGHPHVKSRSNINGHNTLHIDEGLEDFEEVVLPEDIKQYMGIAVVECDVLDSVSMTSALYFDNDDSTYFFAGNAKCTTDDSAVLVPLTVAVNLDADDEIIYTSWQLTSPIVVNKD
jgi:hypothetical protein